MSDDNIQTMRDKGIADACSGTKPIAWIDEDGWVFVIGPDGEPALPQTPTEYREAFAYARAFEANR